MRMGCSRIVPTRVGYDGDPLTAQVSFWVFALTAQGGSPWHGHSTPASPARRIDLITRITRKNELHECF
jgi:hypothetical protein